MKENDMLTVASLVTLLLATIHLADDVARGMSPGGFGNLIGILVCVVWLYAILILRGRRSGYIIVLLMSLLMTGIPAIHMQGVGMGFGTIRSGGVFFVWTLLALGVGGMFSLILSVRALMRLRNVHPA